MRQTIHIHKVSLKYATKKKPFVCPRRLVSDKPPAEIINKSIPNHYFSLECIFKKRARVTAHFHARGAKQTLFQKERE
ncbi:hypothetical protein CEXT_80811 [Caerostris extrusa]|uniref:Uncharacterized protein n=1 Tax=Caerostris extrusa TaxID=172846 RepID=A0AAV4N8J2_CAEEX|nr:hypothetical protein CEXT_80811 [Caerostris extrusa]